MSDQTTDVTVSAAPERSRYEAYLGDNLAGYAEYELGDGVITFTHTEVDPDFGGRGIGGALARCALDDVRDQGGRRVEAECSFIAGWMAKHPEYLELQ